MQNQTTPQSSSSTQASTAQPLEKKGGSCKWIVVGLIVLLFLTLVCGGLGVAGYLLWKKGEEEEESSGQKDRETQADEEEEEDTIDVTEEESEITAIDATWNKYTNHKLGFSMNIPKTMLYAYGACEWSELTGDHSYRPVMKETPVKVFEDFDNNTVYVTVEYYYELRGETVESNVSYYSDCEKVTNTLNHAKDATNMYQQGWEIEMESVEGDDDLDQFIKNRYGPGCELGGEIETDQKGVYEIVIGGDMSDPLGSDPTKCNLNYITQIFYYPAENKIAVWDLGQGYAFYRDDYNAYDEEMIESFRFE